MLRYTIVAVLTLGLIGATLAHDFRVGDLHIDHPWARVTAAGQANGAAYLTVANSGAADRILAAESPVAERAELHTHVMEDGVARMRQVEAIDLPAGGTTPLEPGGLHVMLFGLTAPLAVGDTFPLTLVTEKAGRIELEVKVEPVTFGLGGSQDHSH